LLPEGTGFQQVQHSVCITRLNFMQFLICTMMGKFYAVNTYGQTDHVSSSNKSTRMNASTRLYHFNYLRGTLQRAPG